MSPEKLRCPDCRKLVTNGRWLGTLHLCLLPHEIAEVRRQREQVEWQKRAQIEYVAAIRNLKTKD